MGDFRGLTEKLDYLQWLGIDCIWLLPFYQSPLRDGGYDISDFTNIHPDYGTVDDVQELIDAAHARRIRVIADLVMNHTSSEHPWFQRARQAPPGSPERDCYVWSDTDDRYQDARIIFIDTESSNWTWDPVAGQYYWHRFFYHQPDLNYDNPEVQEAMLDVLRFWLDLGLDGFRLDAVPYLFEREGTNCENLPETHEYLKRIRREVEENYPDRVLLAEANQWPADVVQYFGDRRRVPDGLPLPGHAADVHGPAPRGGGPDLRGASRTPRRSQRPASGASSCATTTSSRSRWSPTRSGTTCTASTPRIRA